MDNRNFADATIYATDGDIRTRLGRVTGKTSTTFSFPWYQEQIQMVVRFTGGGSTVSGFHSVVPGATDDLLLIISVNPSGMATLIAQRRG